MARHDGKYTNSFTILKKVHNDKNNLLFCNVGTSKQFNSSHKYNYNFVHILSTQIFVPFLDGFYPSRDVGSTPELHILNVVSQEPSIVVK